MRRLRLSALAAALALTGLACAPAATAIPEVDQSYAVTVVNELPHPMIVSVDDGALTRRLGTVGANRQERFVISGADRRTVTFIAIDEGETQTVRRTVTLVAGGTVEIRLN
jgi:hypothetical protein